MATRFLSVVVVLVHISLQYSNAEVFTAITHMEGLMSVEGELIQGLNAYLTKERARLDKLEQFASRVEEALSFTTREGSMHLNHPVNAFQLVNRYKNGWMKLHESIYENNGEELMANVSLSRHQFPTEEDFKGAITALWRLQETYKVPAIKMAKANLGTSKGLAMTAIDCYNVARVAYIDQDWDRTKQWMLAALEQFDSEQGNSTLDIADVYDHLAFSEYKMGNMKRAARYNKEMLQYDPTHQRGLQNREYFNKMAEEDPDTFVDTEEKEEEPDTEHDKYEALCREPGPVPKKMEHKLVCFYFNNHRNPRLILKPAKVEVMWIKPNIYIFRDFISEPEMARLKELAIPKLQRALTTNIETGNDEPADYRISKRATVHGPSGQLIPASYRISKSGWLSPGDDPLGIVARLDQRIEDTTGLDMSTAEQLQVVNYGIGGHYEPHYDFARREEDAFSDLGTGNRIATILMYMSDVEMGGATVFPIVGARIPPTNGDTAFWYNLKRSGDGDMLTRHAGCPVLVGSKWVCNKWIHERGQEFRRPCALSPDK